MANATTTIEGFVAKDPEARNVTGHTVVDVTVPVTPQKKNQSGQWEDAGETVWYKATFWDAHGEAVQAAVSKGSLVTITGTPKQDLYLRNGEAAGSISLDFPTIAVVVRKPSRNAPAQPSAPAEEPWAPAAPLGGYDDSELPF